MKKKRLNQILGFFLAATMVVQINAGSIGTTDVYADSTADQTTAVSEGEMATTSNSEKTQTASTPSDESKGTIISSSQTSAAGNDAASGNDGGQTSDAGDTATSDNSTAEQAGSTDTISASDTTAQSAESSSEESEEKTEEETASEPVTFDSQTFADGSSVQVTAPAGAFPEGVQLTVTLQSSTSVLDEAKTASGNDDLTEENVAAYDFDFFLGDQHDLAPEAEISVTFRNVALAGSDENPDFSVYHVDDNDSVEKVSEQALSDETISEQNISFTMQADQFSTYMVLRAPAVTTEGIWIGDDTDTKYDTLAAAVGAADQGAVIHMSGSFDSTQVSGNTINKGITLDIAGDTTITGTDSAAGLIIASGSALQCSNNATLTMTGFTNSDVNKAAVVIRDGGTWTDGHYEFRDNFYAFYNQGSVVGSNGRNKLVISSDNTGLEKSLSMNQSSTATYTNAAITIRMNRNSDQDGQDAGLGGPLILNNVKLDTQNLRFCLQGQGQTIDGTPYVLYAVDSEIHVSGRWSGSNWGGSYQTFMVESNKGYMSNSQLYVSGSRIGANSVLEATNGSLISVKDSPDGGLTANWGGSFILRDSTIEGEGLSNPLYGTGNRGTNAIRIEGNSVINTAAKDATLDNGGALDKDSYIVMGGSFLIKYNGESVAIPTNEAGETLTYFKLTDPSWNTIDVPASGDHAGYTYSVKNASSDGNKYVWVPGAKVTFQLNNDNAFFSDGTTTDKVHYAMRGYKMSDATEVNGEADLAGLPDTPSALGYEFDGWYYEDSNGDEQKFDTSVTIPAEGLTVYARWKGAENYGVVYHKNLETADDPTVVVSGSSPDRTIMALTWDEILSKNADFSKDGYQFVSWNTQADGKGTSYATGEVITLAEGTDKLDLYAQYEPVYVTVTFSANGGTFDKDSVIRQHPDVFEVSTDDRGGEVATLKGNFQAGTNLNDYIKSLDSSWNWPYYYINSSSSSFATRDYYKQKVVKRNGWFGTYYTYYWYTDADATTQASIDSDTIIKTDTTYYVGWDLSDSVEHIEAYGIHLDGDMYSDSTLYSSSETRLLFQGETFALSGSLDVTPVKDEMDSLNEQFGESSATASGITLEDCSSEFTAVLTIPEGIDIPENPEVTLTGLEGLFEIKEGSVTVDQTARTITIPMTLINSYDFYSDLYNDVQAVKNTAVVTVNGFKISDDVYEDASQPDTFAMTGELTGEFSSIAKKVDDTTGNTIVKKFDFSWTGVQKDEGRQEGQDASDPTIQYTVQAARNTTGTLYGDILVDGNTQNSSVYQVVLGDKVDFTGALDVTPIQDYMTYLEGEFDEDPSSDITLKKADGKTDGVDFSMIMSVTFPDGIEVPSNLKAVVKDNSFGAFSITGTIVDGQRVTILFGLTDDSISTYAKLKEAVNSAGIDGSKGRMEILLPGLTVKTADKNLQVKVNSMNGSFHAYATKGEATKAFAYDWNVDQSCSTTNSELLGNGKDSTQASDDNKTISFTLKANKADVLDGDILINGDTEHNSVYSATVVDELTYTATYDVSSIKDKMAAIEEKFGASNWSDDQYKQIALSDIASVFTTKIEVPDALSDVWPSDISSYTLSGTDAFKITDVTKDGNIVTVTMTLTGDNNDSDDNDVYDNYYELRDAIKNDANTSQVLTLTVAPFAIPATVDTNSNITVVGSVNGYMHSDATYGDHVEHFSFGWQSTQDTDIPVKDDASGAMNPDGGGDGTDKILENEEDKTQISATFTAAPQPVTRNVPTVTKTISGDTPDTDETFTFTLAADADNSTLPTDMDKDSMPMPSEANGSQSLTKTIEGTGKTNFGTITFSEAGTYVYTVTEVKGSAEGYTYDESTYTVTYDVAESDGKLTCTRTIAKNGTTDNTLTTLDFTNEYQKPAEPVTPISRNVPTVTKTISGDTPDTDETFTFTLAADPDASTLPTDMDKDSMPMPSEANGSQSLTKTIEGTGKTNFGTITFSEAGTYSYTIAEVKGNAEGYTYDNTIYTVTYVVVKSADGQMNCTRTIRKDGTADSTLTELAFTNVYEEPVIPTTSISPITVDDPPVEKVLNGDIPVKAETFTFTLAAAPDASTLPTDMDKDNMPMPSEANGSQSLTKTITGEGTVEFGQLTFSEEGIYVYKVSEIKGEADGYTYDDTVYTITYVITETDGKLFCTRTIAKDDGTADSTLNKLTFTNIYQKPKSSGTADKGTSISSKNASSTTAVSAKTGDDTPIALWIGLICIAGAVCVILIVTSDRRKKKENQK